MTALPAVEEGGDRYSYTWFEQAWIPAGAENIDAAKQFLAFLYSDTACEIFAACRRHPARARHCRQAWRATTSSSTPSTTNGAKAAMGDFAAYKSVAGLGTNREEFFDPVNSLVSGTPDPRRSGSAGMEGRQRPDARQPDATRALCKAQAKLDMQQPNVSADVEPRLIAAFSRNAHWRNVSLPRPCASARKGAEHVEKDKGRKRFYCPALAPAVILFVIFMMLPTLNVFRMSLFRARRLFARTRTFVGFANFTVACLRTPTSSARCRTPFCSLWLSPL